MNIAISEFLTKGVRLFGVLNQIFFSIHEGYGCMILMVFHKFSKDLVGHGVVENMYRLGEYQFGKEK